MPKRPAPISGGYFFLSSSLISFLCKILFNILFFSSSSKFVVILKSSITLFKFSNKGCFRCSGSNLDILNKLYIELYYIF